MAWLAQLKSIGGSLASGALLSDFCPGAPPL
jgi:hypothetical protein